MIFGIASDSPGGLRHHAVSVDVAVKGKRYLVTVEEIWQAQTGIGPSGIGNYKEPKEVTVEFGTLDEFISEAWTVFEGDEPRTELQGIDLVLLGEAMKRAEEEVSEVLIFNGAAHLEEGGVLVIDWDEAKCRRLIKKAAEK
jgi:hypothetical protein